MSNTIAPLVTKIQSNLLLSEASKSKYGDFNVTQSADGTKALLKNNRYEITIDSAGGQRNITIVDKKQGNETASSTGDPHVKDAAGKTMFDYKEDLKMNYPDMEVFIETTPPEKNKNGVPVAWAQTISIKDDAGNVTQVNFGDPSQRKTKLTLDVTKFYGKAADDQIKAIVQSFEGVEIWEDGKTSADGSSTFLTDRIAGEKVSSAWIKDVEAKNISVQDATGLTKKLEAQAKELGEKAKAWQSMPEGVLLDDAAQAAWNKQKGAVSDLLKKVIDDPDSSPTEKAQANKFLGQIGSGKKLSYRQIGMFLALIAGHLQKQAAAKAESMGTDTSKIAPAESQALTDLNMDIKMLTEVIAKLNETTEATFKNLNR